MNDQKLEDEFHRAMQDVYEQAAKLGYRATRFLQLLRRRGGLAAAKQLLGRPGISPGLTRLCELQSLDISMEATVLQPRFRSLFSHEELQTACKRLKDLDWHPPGVHFMKAKFGHAGIVVRDLDSQIDFYSRIFGLEVETRFTREGSFIDNVTGLERARLEVAILGNEDRPSTIELLKYRSHPDHSPARAANAAYCSHVMFVVDDIESAWREVIDAGGQPFSAPQLAPGGDKSVFYFRDPEGAILELVAYHDV